MKKTKRFSDTEEMLSFIKGIRQRTSESLKLLKQENKKYDQLLRKEESELKEVEARYHSSKK
jgi:hypothetical protein